MSKIAIVTGASKGIGRACALRLAKDGMTVIVNYSRSDEAANKAVEEIKAAGGSAAAYKADVSDPEQVKTMFKDIADQYGTVDVLVNNAGIQRRHMPEDFPIEEWDEVLAVNLNAVWIMAQLAGRVMLAKGSGKIINIASLNSFLGGTTVPAYTAAKSGVAGLTRALSDDWAGRGVNVNAIAPGYIATSLNTALIGNPDREPKILARLPKKRWGEPDDMKGAVIFLASAASDYVTGVTLAVDGGYLCT